MKKSIVSLYAIVVRATISAAACAALASFTAHTAYAAELPNTALVAHGEYLARAGDCIACHTAQGGRPFAGGLKFDTPIGAIYSTNITPDANTGIGKWSYDDFARAVRQGVRPNGETLYPAMPYPSYARLSDDDMKALYAYFMRGVAPVRAPNRAVDIPWPLSMRWPLGAWRMLFAPKVQAFDGAHYNDAIVARGAYLVQGLGHCGACHTPRAPTMQELALTDLEGDDFLAGGGPIDGWVPSSLRGNPRTGLGSWNEDDIVQFLKSGRNLHTAAFGGMTDVVQHSMQHMNDADLLAIARYLKTLPASDPKETAYAYDPAAANRLQNGDASARGAAVYRDNCMACHRSDGRGYTRVFPALGGNPVVQGKDPTSLIHVLLAGSALEGTKSAPSSFTMPPLGWRLSDQEVADVSTFVRASWGNAGAPVSAADVAKVRKTLTVSTPAPPPGATLKR
ncbi:cytochrome c [Paraburkholderia silvatlantica]|uniref:Mono/diheme cytochrome c family protein n=1 Tax=Paraburkholderia silvatlantica TaxID=321895 RepID=A0A2U1AD92_9BURK|nr:cytochrome c [Paraburkholderia silvatlantica]MBB2926021.1 mono/diheme cytochrome c family protein [Paraburkholderia silvatlantica]PVY33554.1 mono/diheme cytochrome c family protein [Paraburkholderia silvatlantica]PXW38494.1 mono/diheme cytochrome c family protein [Paraburkholderia silvatlantica]PYE27698.1 mono/diheme cytochrome c family protein [Paraburkholderia silvatlantica]TDQ92946.1 mono/diheme cytochrome c family protein [Paraburkholderia silvatlantica]